MIKLKDLITEAQLSKLQIFSPGTGGTLAKGQSNMKFDPSKETRIKVNLVFNKFKIFFYALFIFLLLWFLFL